MESKNLNALLQGRILLLETSAEEDEHITWVELSLQDEIKPPYPFRTDHYAMKGMSPYANSCKPEDAAFKLRTSVFLKSDINNEYEPSYDNVGDYILIESMSELLEYLEMHNMNLNDFVDSSSIEGYPL